MTPDLEMSRVAACDRPGSSNFSPVLGIFSSTSPTLPRQQTERVSMRSIYLYECIHIERPSYHSFNPIATDANHGSSPARLNSI